MTPFFARDKEVFWELLGKIRSLLRRHEDAASPPHPPEDVPVSM